jgi:hypothetical protein
MPTANEYLRKAEECYRMANEAKTEEDRLACLELAQTWIAAAYQEQDERRRARDGEALSRS